MRNLIVAVCLVVFIVTVDIVISHLIKESYDNFSSLGEEYIISLEAGDFTKSEDILQKMKDSWERDEFFLKWVANHKTVEEIGSSFKISEIFLKYKDAPHAAAECKMLMHFLEHLYENEQVSFGNIF